MDLVEIEAASDLPDNGLFPAEVRLVLDNGTTLVERREIPPGAPQRPFTADSAYRKFRSCASGVLDENRMRSVAEMITKLDELPGVAELCEQLEGSEGGTHC
jgi:2-methylcitrate dehydratase PrpD